MGFSPKPSGLTSTTEGKLKIIERTKKMIAKSKVIITLPFEGVTMEQTDLLRRSLPECVTASIVKNALIRKCVEGNPDFLPLAENLKHENMFLFCPEGYNKEAYLAFQKWQKEVKRTEPQFNARVVVLEGHKFVGDDLEDIAVIESKKEYMRRICVALQSVPQNLARAIRAIPAKMVEMSEKRAEDMKIAAGGAPKVLN